MIKRNGKAYVVLEFADESDAAFFECAFNDRHRNDLFEASAEARLADEKFAALDEVNVRNTNTAPVTGVLNQIGVIGNRVQ